MNLRGFYEVIQPVKPVALIGGSGCKRQSEERDGEVAEHAVLDENKDARRNILVVDDDYSVLATLVKECALQVVV